MGWNPWLWTAFQTYWWYVFGFLRWLSTLKTLTSPVFQTEKFSHEPENHLHRGFCHYSLPIIGSSDCTFYRPIAPCSVLLCATTQDDIPGLKQVILLSIGWWKQRLRYWKCSHINTHKLNRISPPSKNTFTYLLGKLQTAPTRAKHLRGEMEDVGCAWKGLKTQVVLVSGLSSIVNQLVPVLPVVGFFGHWSWSKPDFQLVEPGRFVFGGWDGHDTLDDLYEFSITTSQWCHPQRATCETWGTFGTFKLPWSKQR